MHVEVVQIDWLRSPEYRPEPRFRFRAWTGSWSSFGETIEEALTALDRQLVTVEANVAARAAVTRERELAFQAELRAADEERKAAAS